VPPRSFDRNPSQLRPVRFHRHYTKHAEGSVLVEMGHTKVLCTASVEEKVPPFLKGKGTGWVTAEYGMLPRATHTRGAREAAAGKQSGRTQEIQRLIGRSLRSITKLNELGERTIWIDCDVIQADGGTRTASITGSFIALTLALGKLYLEGRVVNWPLRDWVAAISVGMIKGVPTLDLNYAEDSSAEVDMNVVATDKMQFIEVQATAEGKSFSDEQMQAMLALARSGIGQLIEKQREVLGSTLTKVDEKARTRLNQKFR